GELGGSDLATDFGKLAGIVFAEVIGQVILKQGELKLALLLGAPFFIAPHRNAEPARTNGPLTPALSPSERERGMIGSAFEIGSRKERWVRRSKQGASGALKSER